MTKYDTFFTIFVISIIALIVFLVFYLNAVFGFAFRDHADQDPVEILFTLFNPAVIVSLFVLAISNLLYRILGIVHVAKSNAGDGEKALWIIGFIFMGFVTAIVFLVLAKGRKFV
jgi:hypothetical protein